MNRLPQELYDEIGELLQGPGFNRPLLATISCQWKAAIERQTFREIRVRSDDLDRFRDIVHNGRRRYVTKLEYAVILPPYDDDKRGRFEREDDRRANDEAFTTAIHGLFSLLKSWDISRDGCIKLSLKQIYSPSDRPSLRPGPIDRERRGDNNTVVDLGSWRFYYSFLRLLRASELPIVPVVRSFATHVIARNMGYRVPIDIAAKFPNLRRAKVRLAEWESRYLGLRREQRHDLAQALTELIPESSALEYLSLYLGSVWFWCPDFSLGNLNLDHSTTDELGSAIRTATGNMTTLKELWFIGPIDATLLWPGPARALREPYWQNIKCLGVIFSARRPTGGCYFRHTEPIMAPPETEVPPGYGPNEVDDAMAAKSFDPNEHVDLRGSFGAEPDDASLVPLMKAFGRACSQMPRLRGACLSTAIPATPAERASGECMKDFLYAWGVWYYSPKTLPVVTHVYVDPAFTENLYERRLFWNVRDWRPPSDLQGLLRSLGRETWGSHLVEKFL
ncbi:hypothetical protein F5Y09DRAFT_98255 [Xylaria sp. FL1042]|nr:hypothetical protein F5Y09DRAFT_98255 [Xylaria sp. FL1042]